MDRSDRSLTTRRGVRLGRLLGLLVLVLLLVAAAPPPRPASTESLVRSFTLAAAPAVPVDGPKLDAQAVSTHFSVRAQHEATAKSTLAKAERGWAILAPHFPKPPPTRISIAVIEDQKIYQRIQPAPMTRGFATFGGTQIVLSGEQLDQEVVTHELAHIFLGLNIPADLTLPDWFNEGFAQFASGARPDALEMMYYASGGQLLSLPQLDKVDALRSPNRQLATLQGLAVVKFLVDTYGQQRFWELIHHLQTADSLNQAMQKTYGLTDLQLDKQWANYADQNYSLLSPPMLRWLGLAALGGLAAVAAGVFFVRETRRRAAEGPDLTWGEIEAAREAEERGRSELEPASQPEQRQDDGGTRAPPGADRFDRPGGAS